MARDQKDSTLFASRATVECALPKQSIKRTLSQGPQMLKHVKGPNYDLPLKALIQAKLLTRRGKHDSGYLLYHQHQRRKSHLMVE